MSMLHLTNKNRVFPERKRRQGYCPRRGRLRLESLEPRRMLSFTPTEITKLLADDGAARDRFGFTVDIEGDTAVVGANTAYIGTTPEAGAAYVFTRSNGTWSQQAKLTASDAVAYDWFGQSVSISGDTIVVGAHLDDDDDDVILNAGSAYVFVRNGTTWTEQAKLNASEPANELFGFSVSVSGDTAVVGSFSGNSAHVFTRSGTTWTEQAELTASSTIRLGAFVSVEDDTAVITDYYNNHPAVRAGAAYVFTRSGTTWTEQAKLTASDGAAGDEFGRSVSLSGDTIVVGAHLDDDAGLDSGSAYVFVRDDSTWSEQAKLTASDGAGNDGLGFSSSVSGDTIVVGASSAFNVLAGSAYVFTRGATTWTEQAKLTASDPTELDQFGYSAAVSGDTVLVGAIYDDDNGYHAGATYVYETNRPPTADDAVFAIDENSANGTVVGTVPAGDPDVGDSLTYSITSGNSLAAFAIDDLDGEITVNDSTILDFETTPVFTLGVQVEDAGGLTDAATVTVNLNDVDESELSLQDGVLTIVSTNGDDAVTVSRSAGGLTVTTSFGITETFPLADVDSIQIVGSDGNDVIDLGFLVFVSAIIDGGPGDDVITGGSGNDQIDGGAGNDQLNGGFGSDTLDGGEGDDTLNGGFGSDTLDGGEGDDNLAGGLGADILVGAGGIDALAGGLGRDLLIGGDDADTLSGGWGQDLLIAGRTSYDDDLPALDAVLAAWTSGGSYNARVTSIRTLLQPGMTVFDDGAQDTLAGNGGRDWFFAALDDVLSDRIDPFEYLDLLSP